MACWFYGWCARVERIICIVCNGNVAFMLKCQPLCMGLLGGSDIVRASVYEQKED